MTKAGLRKKYRTLRHHLSKDDIEDFSLVIANRVLELPVWNFSLYHVFLSIVELHEINTDHILSILAGKDKHIVVSRSDLKNKTMTNFLLTDSTKIIKNIWNIPEPIEGIEIENPKIDVVFVPLLAFDNDGNRVGYGKGFYDQFLSACRPETVKIGLSFFESETTIEGITEDDIKLDYCVTPDTIYSF